MIPGNQNILIPRSLRSVTTWRPLQETVNNFPVRTKNYVKYDLRVSRRRVLAETIRVISPTVIWVRLFPRMNLHLVHNNHVPLLSTQSGTLSIYFLYIRYLVTGTVSSPSTSAVSNCLGGFKVHYRFKNDVSTKRNSNIFIAFRPTETRLISCHLKSTTVIQKFYSKGKIPG